ncbi:alpha/beta hydrolase [Flectobacillus major]|uniref:alpha/beta hydrolase n=1 Tax=Flectobacillus major TaxID=103 RepID=UPI0005C76CF2|nr:alpha/beta fold hydrolase [Flectobacillus major]
MTPKFILKRVLFVMVALFIILNFLLAFQAYRFTYFYEASEVAYKKPEQMTLGEKISGGLFGFKFPKRKIDTLPSLPFKSVILTTAQSLHLKSWFVKADSVALGTVILFHGHASNKQKVLAEATYFHELGYNTLSVDLRAHGESDGNICTIGVNESEDVEVAFNYVKNTLHEKNIIFWGVSLGAATILKGIHDFGLTPQKVILECPFATMEDAVKGRLRSLHIPATPISQILMFWGSLERGFWAFSHRPVDYAKAVKVPVLLNWGKHDPRVTMAETEAIFEALPSNNKKMVIYEKSAHQSFCRSETAKWKSEIQAFVK